MTAPGAGVPDRAYTPASVGGMQNMTESSVMATLRAPVDQSTAVARGGFLGLLDQLGEAIRGVLTIGSGTLPVIEQIYDAQRELRDRMDLVGLLSGYAVAFMPVSPYKPPNGFRVMEFTQRLGPQKNATVDGDGNITVAQGTWLCFAQVTSAQHDHLPVFVRIEVLYPVGDSRITTENEGVYSAKEFRTRTAQNRDRSYPVVHPAVCPEPGYRIRVRTRYDMGVGINLIWKGGTMLSHLAVVRLDLDASNAVVMPTVPETGSQ